MQLKIHGFRRWISFLWKPILQWQTVSFRKGTHFFIIAHFFVFLLLFILKKKTCSQQNQYVIPLPSPKNINPWDFPPPKKKKNNSSASNQPTGPTTHPEPLTTCTRLYPIHKIQGPALGFFTARPDGPEAAENPWATGGLFSSPLPGGPLQLLHGVITPLK